MSFIETCNTSQELFLLLNFKLRITWVLIISSPPFIHPSLLSFPLHAFPSPRSSIWWCSALEITWLQINTLEEFVVLLKSAKRASESRPLCPPTHPGLYNSALKESDLRCIPVSVQCLQQQQESADSDLLSQACFRYSTAYSNRSHIPALVKNDFNIAVSWTWWCFDVQRAEQSVSGSRVLWVFNVERGRRAASGSHIAAPQLLCNNSWVQMSALPKFCHLTGVH